MKTKPKSLRFTADEEAEIQRYVQLCGEQEAVIMERVAMRGLREERLDRALLAYLGGASSSEAAAMAGAGRHAFLTKAIERGIPTLDDTPEDMYRDLGQVADLLQDPRLAAALQVAQAQLETNRT